MSKKSLPTAADKSIAKDIEGESGGSSTWLDTREPVTGTGYMVGQASDELLAGKPDRVYPRPANPQDIAQFHAEQAPRYAGDSMAAHGAWANSATGYVMDVSRRIEDPEEARRAGQAQLQEEAYALPGTKFGNAGEQAGEYGAAVLLNMNAKRAEGDWPSTTAERPIPPVLHHFGINDSDPRWNPHHLDTPMHGFTNYEAENKSWSVAGGLVPTPEPPNEYGITVAKADNGMLRRPQQPHTMGDLLRGINTRRADMAREAYRKSQGL